MQARPHATTLPVLGTLADAARFVAAHPVVFVGVVPNVVWLLVATVVAPDEGLFPGALATQVADDRFDWWVEVPSMLLQALSTVLTTAIVASVADGMRSWTDVRARFVRSVSAAVVFEALLAMPGWVVHAVIGSGDWAALPALLRGVLVVGTWLLFVASLYAVYASIRLSFVIPAIVVDGVDLSTAVRQSWTLLRGRFWSVVFLCAIPSLVTLVAYPAPHPVLPLVGCFGTAFIQTALVLAYLRLSGGTPLERSSPARATSVSAPA